MAMTFRGLALLKQTIFIAAFLAVSFVSASRKGLKFTPELLEPGKLNLARDDEGAKSLLVTTGCRLNRVPLNLGERLPNLDKLQLNELLAPERSPTEKDASAAVPCLQVGDLIVSGSLGSPKSLEWVNLLFPNITRLEIGAGVLPIQSAGEAAPTMTNITNLTISISDIRKVSFPIIANLKLFPSVTSVKLTQAPITVPKTEREKLEQNQTVSSGSDNWDMIDGSIALHELLEQLPVVFSRLTELSIDAPIFEMILNANQEQGLSPRLPFTPLNKLNVSCLGGRLEKAYFGMIMLKVFPSVSHIKLDDIGSSIGFHLTDNNKILERRGSFCLNDYGGPDTLLPTVTNITITDSKISCPPEFIRRQTPEIESLVMTNCGLERLSSGGNDTSSPHGDCLALLQLKHLDISENPALNSTLEAMHAHQPSIRSDANPPLELEAPTGGIYAPQLETLDIRGSFRDRLPQHFFQACPKIKELKLSFDPEHGCNTPEWWESLGSLTELETLYVEIRPLYSPIHPYKFSQENHGFTGDTIDHILDDLANTFAKVWNLERKLPTVSFVKDGSLKPIPRTIAECLAPLRRNER